MTISNNKLLIGASGGGSDPINVEDVFSTFLYEGNGGTQTINNGIDIAGEGGLVWIKNRDADDTHVLTDTVRGATKILQTPTAAAEATDDDTITAFNSTGFALGDDVKVNTNNESYCAWTFRKNPKFFDIVTYTGTGSTQNISHNLGAVPAVIIVKSLSSPYRGWSVYHKDASPTGNPQNGRVSLNTNSQWYEPPAIAVFANLWNQTAPTDSVFTVGSYVDTNENSQNYVAYLFAHNDDDGEFGLDGDQDIIKCGGYTTDSSGNATIDLGFEPQFVITKRTNDASDWNIWDTMRGWYNGSNYDYIAANSTAAETGNANYGNPTSTGFTSNGVIGTDSSGIYIAIRRPNMATITDATEVFDVKQGVNSIPAFDTGFTVDLALQAANITSSTSWRLRTRLTGPNYLIQNDTNTETSSTSSTFKFDLQTGYRQTASNNTTVYGWNWKRAKGFCDVVCYSGTGSARTVAHGLGVAPEMMWVKNRGKEDPWAVYYGDNTDYLVLNENATTVDNANYWSDTSPTSSVFTVGTDHSVNASGELYIAYLFATLAGVSKVGSVTHSGSSTDVDCGFSAGARLVMLKRNNSSGAWYWWDSVRGIIAGNDPYLRLNTSGVEVTNTDFIDPLASGFQISGDFTDGDYIFYAIA